MVFLQGYITATVVAFPLLFKETQSRPGATLSHMYSNKIGLELTVGERTGPHKIPLRATRSALERLVRRNGPPDLVQLDAPRFLRMALPVVRLRHRRSRVLPTS